MVEPMGRKQLSWRWRVVLTKLAEYGDQGIDETAFKELMGDDDPHSQRGEVGTILSQMFFTGMRYVDCRPGGIIAITEKGKEALADG